jgi:hypothetical protein
MGSGVPSSIVMPTCRSALVFSILGSTIRPTATRVKIVVDTGGYKKAKDFAASADLKEAMEKVGVLGNPTIYFLESID